MAGHAGPHAPQAVDVGMMGEKHRIESRRGEHAHVREPGEVLRIRSPKMDKSVRTRLELAGLFGCAWGRGEHGQLFVAAAAEIRERLRPEDRLHRRWTDVNRRNPVVWTDRAGRIKERVRRRVRGEAVDLAGKA